MEEKIHFVAPKPSDLTTLMEGMFAAHRRMEAGKVQAVVHATAIAFGFVYMHPFEDGNGRIHRFLIHNILARRGFTPPGVIFPVSAAMLQDAPKRKDHFSMLTDEEVAQMQQAVKESHLVE
jgi:Fic family protein